jgi:L-fuconolactonase
VTDRSPTYEIVDAQLHAYSPEQLADEGHGATAEGLLSMMDAVGVSAAVLVHPSKYGYEPVYSLEAAAAHPTRFGVVGLVDPDAPDLDDRLRRWRERPGLLAVRLVAFRDEQRDRLRAGGFETLLAAAERHEVPLLTYSPGALPLIKEVARAHRDLQIVVDHLGLLQPPLLTPDPDPFQTLPDLLDLAAFDNVSVKVTGAPTLSREGFPFDDLWPSLERVLGAFGIERLMWGTDITRVHTHEPYPGRHTYFEAVSFIRDTERLSTDEKASIMGENLRRIFRWPADESLP